MKNLDVLRLFNLLQSYRLQEMSVAASGQGSPFGKIPAGFAIKVAHNLRMLQAQRDIVVEALQGPWDDVIAPYVGEEIVLLRKHAGLKDDVVIPEGTMVQIEDKAGWEEERAALKARHPGIDEALQNRATAQEVLKQESPNIPLWKIKLEELPEFLDTFEAGEVFSLLIDIPASS